MSSMESIDITEASVATPAPPPGPSHALPSVAQSARPRSFLLVDGENIDATLGTSILGRRPHPDERPRWDRLLSFTAERWDGATRGLFFLNAGNGMPMSFVQALRNIGYLPVPLSGDDTEKVVDLAIQRTLAALTDREADVMLVSHDGDFLEAITALLDGQRRVGVMGFDEFRNNGFLPLVARGLETYDLEHDVKAFNAPLPRLRVIPIEDFDPTPFLD